MNKKRTIRQWIAVALIAMAAAIVGASMFRVVPTNTESAAEALGKKVRERLAILDDAAQTALDSKDGTWTTLHGLPKDMVVYRYVEDTLQSWANQFPIRSDDIRPRAIVRRLGESRGDAVSPLADVTSNWSFANHGPKWYLEKAYTLDDVTVIAGLEIVNELTPGSMNGANKLLKIDDRYSIKPLSASVGHAVQVDGVPLFKLVSESVEDISNNHNSGIQLLAVVLLISGLLLWLSARPSALWLLIVAAAQSALMVWMYFKGKGAGPSSQIFSPLIYADGPVLYSLGAVVIINALITLLVTDFYIARWTLIKEVSRKGSKLLQSLLLALGVLITVAILAYFHFAFRSIIVNSDVNLELYKVSRLSVFSGVIYLSFIALAMALPPMVQMLAPLAKALFGIRYDVFTVQARAVFAAAIGVYFVSMTAALGFRKEERRVDVWANRLAMDRDISLEMRLRAVEGAIAEDQMFGALIAVDGGTEVLRGRLIGNYMGRISQDYDISVLQTGANLGSNPLFQDRIRSAVRLSDNSHFFYSPLGSGRVAYTGIFTWYVPGAGSSSMMISVESKHNREDRGYLMLLGVADPGRISLPRVYSWAKYVDGSLFQYKGSFSYPTVSSDRLMSLGDGHFYHDGWCHFVHNVSGDEVVVISRPRNGLLDYVVSGFMISIVAFLLLMLFSRGKRRSGSSRYFQNRISLVLYFSLFLTLVAMAGFSVWFVQKRTVAERENIMISRVNILQAMMQEKLRQVDSDEELNTVAVRTEVDNVGGSLRCDITLFDTSGQEAISTTPEVYDRMILGHRLDQDAFYNITQTHKRFYIQKEKVGRRSFYAMYAPVFNSSSRMVAILSSPFTDTSQDFETEAAWHIATVITIFLLLLLIARVVAYEVVSRMFRPITELSNKMRVTDVDHLEPLSYDGDDEITPLVEAYNRMVLDLGESSRRLTQAERDKAWTDMARRVAHDLKNPLTPIKLQLQMLIRMKASGNPAWQERFDEVAQTVLYHVDLLADSADQFSTFAKMYDQKPERMDLDAMVRQEVDLFDSRDDVHLEYFGLAGAIVDAPRPQLTRVVVNLLTNAIQAVEENSGEKRLLVSLRNSTEDGFYDIVVEDNGPGVSEQNQDKIFTPDFTTKTSGSGLGLAICRRIVEHCGGTISYSKSFSLGGACFTVKYPKAV